MAPQVEFWDCIDGNSGCLSSKGWELTRIAKVTGVDGEPHRKLYTAWEATGLAINDAHPSVPNCVLRDVFPESEASEIVKFRLVYRSYTYGSEIAYDTWEVIGSVSQFDTWNDINDIPIKVGYEFAPTYKPSPESKTLQELNPGEPTLWSSRIKIGGSVIKMIPELTLRRISRENSSPESMAATYLGRINSGSWRGYAAKTLLCTVLNGKEVCGTSKWDVTYEVQYRPETWDPTIIFIDKNYGKPPDDWKTNAGYPVGGGQPNILPYKQVQIYQSISFAGLPS